MKRRFINVITIDPNFKNNSSNEIVDTNVRQTFEYELTNKGISVMVNKTPMFLNSMVILLITLVP